MTVYARPGEDGSLVTFKPRYENYIGGEWVPPTNGNYFDNPTPVTGQPFTEVPASTAEDIELALDAAHAAAPAWGKTSPTERANILLQVADRMAENLEMLAVAETWDNGKAVRETLNADLPLAVDHFRYFAAAIRTQEGGLSQLDEQTVAYHFHEPLGVVGQIIPWNFPILMAVWKLAPALAAGNAVVLKPAEQTPASILVLMELVGDLLPPGVVNVVNGFGLEAGKPLARTSASARSRSPVRPRRAGSSCSTPRRTSSRSPSSSAARARTSSSMMSWPRTTPIGTRRRRASQCSPSTRAKSARARRGRSSRRHRRGLPRIRRRPH